MTNLTDVVESTAIRPFQVSVPEAELTDLRRRNARGLQNAPQIVETEGGAGDGTA